MCGIAGIVDFSGRPVSRAEIGAMTDALAHRGPDGDGFWFSARGDVALGHRRLAIIDTGEGGIQPRATADDRYVMTYNGEVYNFLELREELEALGAVFATQSDIEVVLTAFQHWGEACLDRFNGMWALAIHDTGRDELFIARDRFGVKPLYFAWTPKRFAFASELKALRSSGVGLGDVDRDVAGRLVMDTFRVEGSTRTMFTGVTRLQGGHCAWVSARGVRPRRWWNTLDHLSDVPVGAADREERFRELFLDSVRLRMRSDVPIGTCLSGGFDSTAVTCAMAHIAQTSHRRAPPSWRHAFVAAYPGWQYDERPEAEVAAAYAGIEPNILDIHQDANPTDLDQILSDLGEVYIDPGIGAWSTYREVRRAGVTVTLDGHGADEMMGAYRPAGGSLKFSVQTAIGALATRSRLVGGLFDRTRQQVLNAAGTAFLNHDPGERLDLVGDGDRLPADWGPMSRGLFVMFHGTILPTLLRHYDRLSMAHGIEARMPFMDWRLVSYVMSLPDESKFDDGYTKRIARQSLKGLMPETIRTQKKKIGFNNPTEKYLQGPLRDWSRDLLSRPSAAFSEVVNEGRLQRRMDQLTAAGRWNMTYAQRIWPYLHLKFLLLEAGV